MWLHVTDFEYRIKNQIQKKEFQMEILKNHRVGELKMKVKGKWEIPNGIPYSISGRDLHYLLNYLLNLNAYKNSHVGTKKLHYNAIFLVKNPKLHFPAP